MTARQKNILKEIRIWLGSNAMTIIAFLSLSWQISSKVGPYAYNKVASTLDTIEVARSTARQVQRDLSEFKVDQHARDNRQDTLINKLITQNLH